MEEVQDEHGNLLVKIVLVDENNESTGVAYVSREDANQILEGKMSIHSELDEATGQTLVTLTPVEPDEGTENIDASGAEVGNVSGGAACVSAEDESGAATFLDAVKSEDISGQQDKDFTGLEALSQVIDNDESGVMSRDVHDDALHQLMRSSDTAPIPDPALNDPLPPVPRSFEPHRDRMSLLRPVILQNDHISAILKASDMLLQTESYRQLSPEPYSKKLGSEAAYQEMLSLMDFDPKNEPPERMEILRKHAILFRTTGSSSKALTLYEQAVNEAAAQICRHQPALLFHKRDLAILAKQCVKMTGIEFPSSRLSYLPGSTGGASGPSGQGLIQNTASGLYRHRDGSGAYHGASVLSKDSPRSSLSPSDCTAIAHAVMQMSSTIPKCTLKSREQCSLVENFVYADAMKISKMGPEKLEEEMDYIRDVSAVYGRYPSGPRNLGAQLTQYDLAVNEAAAWLVRMKPALLTHTRQLIEFSQRAVKASGLNLGKQTSSSNDKWNSISTQRSLAGAAANSTSSNLNQDMMHYRLQGDLFNFGVSSASGLDFSELDDTSGYGVSDHYFASGTSHSILDNDAFSHSIPRYSGSHLDDLSRGHMPLISQTSSLTLQCEEDDVQLDEAEILRVTSCKDLSKVKSLRVPCMGYTSININDLSRCVKLRELDVSENALRQFPRRLHLPELRKLGLSGNRFQQLPLVEQFPHLRRLTLDEKYKQVLNPQMLAYFCPYLKAINGQYFDEGLTEFTVRIIQEAKATVEPHIRSKWDSEFAEKYQSVSLRGDRITIIEALVKQLKDKNLLVDETIGKYKDLLLYRFAEDYLKSKMCDPEDEMLAGVPRKKLGDSVSAGGDISDTDDRDEEEDEEKELENKTAGELALFRSAEELLGGPDWETMTASGITTVITAAVDAQQHEIAIQQANLGRSLRQGKSIVMSIVKPKGVVGRPVAEFLPGELRNKDYVKGYMASEIYKKAVKDTLGLKGTPGKKKNEVGRPRKSDYSEYSNQGGMSKKRSSYNNGVLNEVNSGGFVHSSEISSVASANVTVGPMGGFVRKRGRPSKAAQLAAQVAAAGGSVPGAGGQMISDIALLGGIPARPKRRRGNTRSLRDLCGSYTNQVMIDYDPLHFIRCHARGNDASDNETKVWRCLFEPNPNNPEETTHIVATCGGECVCLINCETGKVMQRYKHLGEEFYTIAWTTVEVESGKRTNLLAAAGKLQEIRLLHPEQLVCYAEMKGHVEDISSMTFHQTQPTILFSGDSKASIMVWDIGVPSAPDNKTRYQLLMRLRCPRLDVNPVLNLIFMPHYAYLVAGCEDGIFAWKITEFKNEKREREPDMELKVPSNKEVCFDGLAQLSDNAIVIKCVDEGELYVFDFASVLERRKGLQRVVPLEIRGHLTWQKTDEVYINVSVRQNLACILCGDNEGSIWIYDLDPYLDDLATSNRKKFNSKPVKILEWPECSVQGNRNEDQKLKESITSGFRNPVVNTVEMSSDGLYLGAVTDNNLVCIWRYAPPALNPGQSTMVGGKQNLLVRPMSSSAATIDTTQQ